MRRCRYAKIVLHFFELYGEASMARAAASAPRRSWHETARAAAAWYGGISYGRRIFGNRAKSDGMS